MAKNQPVNASTQIGVANGNDEGYATLADAVAVLLAAGFAVQLPATDPCNGNAPSNTQDVLDALAAKIASVQAADMDMIADSFAAGDGTITNAGTGDNLSLSMVPTAVATVLASNPAAMQTLAAALLSSDADNSAVLGSDGLIYENDAVI